MALSNMRNEPRREWTEQIIGLVFILVWGYGTYLLANRLAVTQGNEYWVCLVVMMIVYGLLPPLLGILLWVVAHGVGEIICGWMTRLGFDPRPKQRYNRRNP